MRYLFLLMLFALDERTAGLVDEIAASGQIAEIASSSSQRVAPSPQIAPGAPPALAFRMIEGKLRHRYGDLDLVLDDAGH
jgi:hypothetical protein